MKIRGWVWLQLAVAWLPMWALFVVLMATVHDMPLSSGAFRSLSMIVPGALLGILVYRFTETMPWPHPFRLHFIAVHVLASMVYSVTWWILVSVIDTVAAGHLAIAVGPGIVLFLLTGLWLYLIVAGVAYANRAAERTAQLEAKAARAQRDALRSQLHPHFLFNALHTIVQLIPLDPRGAATAAEQLAGALRTTIEEDRDLVSLAEEWAFVERYLSIESIRFGDRLRVHTRIAEDARAAMLPSFALQTLVENAVRHGAAPRAQATQLTIAASLAGEVLSVEVRDDGGGTNSDSIADTRGTGLRRLRERMRWLYGDGATLTIETAAGAGLGATLRIPQDGTHDDSRYLSEGRT